jgi:hypothetical protein
MNYPHTVGELINWDTFKLKDTFGTFTVITGFEGTGRCFWCGKDIEGRRRFCKGHTGCWTKYQEHFSWGYAKSKCIKQANRCCTNCGVREDVRGYYMISTLEVHHIIPLRGKDRVMNVYNIWWNLICLCHDCHMGLHRMMRLKKHDYKPPNTLEEALKVGQSIMIF